MTLVVNNTVPAKVAPSTHVFEEFNGYEYLLMDIASNYGLDKEDWSERLLWAGSVKHHLLKIADMDKSQLSQEIMMQQADEPALFYAGCLALRDHHQGKPSGYPISLDATASGMQLLAILVGCEESAKLCNVIPTGRREDAYTRLYGSMRKTAEEHDMDTANIDRPKLKTAIMTSLYNSTREPKKIFGEGDMLRLFYHIMETKVPGAWALNEVLRDLWQAYAPSHDWVLPDGFNCHVPVESHDQYEIQFLDELYAVTTKVNRGKEEGRALGPNLIHSIDGMVVREMNRRCDYDRDHVIELMKLLSKPVHFRTRTDRRQDMLVQELWDNYQRTGFLSTRIIDALDAENIGIVDPDRIKEMLCSLPERPFHLMCIHDCFRMLPKYGNDARRQYNQILSELAASDLLQDLVSQIEGSPVPVVKIADLSDEILKSNYSIC